MLWLADSCEPFGKDVEFVGLQETFRDVRIWGNKSFGRHTNGLLRALPGCCSHLQILGRDGEFLLDSLLGVF